jgi:hypothetical protein
MMKSCWLWRNAFFEYHAQSDLMTREMRPVLRVEIIKLRCMLAVFKGYGPLSDGLDLGQTAGAN